MNPMQRRARVQRAIEEYNRYREPEARARLVSLDAQGLWVEFTGTFCRTCGAYDWYEDLVWILKDHGLETEIGQVEEFLEGARVWFRWKDQPSG